MCWCGPGRIRRGILNSYNLILNLFSKNLKKKCKEPTTNFDLIRHPNLICTPHLGASSKEAQNRCGLDVANQIVNYVKNGVLEGGVSIRNLESYSSRRIPYICFFFLLSRLMQTSWKEIYMAFESMFSYRILS
jgi:hypothetical protein